MLIVKTHLAPDSFGGSGLFASEFITKGTTIWKYDPHCDQFFTIEEYFSLSAEKRKIVSHHGYRGRVNGINGVFFSHDNDKYMNHSESPNVRYYYRPPSTNKCIDSRHHVAIAEQDIAPHTEITMSYYDLNFPDVPPELYRDIGTCFDFLDPSKTHHNATDKPLSSPAFSSAAPRAIS